MNTDIRQMIPMAFWVLLEKNCLTEFDIYVVAGHPRHQGEQRRADPGVGDYRELRAPRGGGGERSLARAAALPPGSLVLCFCDHRG